MLNIVDRVLTKSFHKLGHGAAVYPKRFIVTSIAVSLLLGTGLLQMNYGNDVQYLFTNSKGRSVYEKAQIVEYFPSNYSGAFSPSRVAHIGRFARIIITAKDGGNLLRSSIWAEITSVDNILHNISISHGDTKLNYSSLCGTLGNTCWENDFVDLGSIMDRVENRSIRIVYPIMVHPETYNTYVLPLHFSGLTLSPDNLTLEGAEALALNYFLKFETEADDLNGASWERLLIETLSEHDPTWKYINVFRATYYSMIAEQEDNTIKVLPYFSITIFLMCCFTVMTALSRDWVKAKPWVAMFGISVATLGSVAAFGFLCYIGITCIGINLAVPFIMLGIGIDDTFVMLSTWRQTNIMDPVPKRLAETYAEAAVSITITSLTDMLSFYVGLLTPIPSVQIFCAYAGTSVFCIYLLQVFCFGAVLGLSGRQEAKNGHAVFWWMQAMPKSEADGKSTMFKVFFTGGVNKADPSNALDNGDNAMMIFFRDYHAKLLTKKWVQALILFLFVGYLGIATYGMLHLEEGLREERLYHDDSYVSKFFHSENKYFKKYRYRVQVAITTPLDYSQPKVQQRIAEIVNDITNSSQYLTPNFSENWLTGFTNYVARYSELYVYNITTEQQFIDVLRKEYFQNNIYEEDVVFNKNFTQIIASRFVFQIVETVNTENVKEAVAGLRRAVDAQKDVNVVIFNPWLGFVDQFTLIRPLTVQLLSIAAAIVMLVAIIFIPNFVTALCVFITIVSTEWGVLGLMALWGVALDMISILCLVMCIGFSVDFSAHISYAYISSEGTSEQRIRKAMYSLGLPIVQGGGSTIIGVLALCFVASYIYQVFFKVVFLVIVCAAWHGLFVLPVLLLIVKPETLFNRCGGKRIEFKIQSS